MLMYFAQNTEKKINSIMEDLQQNRFWVLLFLIFVYIYIYTHTPFVIYFEYESMMCSSE